jgi:hypothetical protein
LNQTEEIEVFPYLKRCTLDIICGKYKFWPVKKIIFNSEHFDSL